MKTNNTISTKPLISVRKQRGDVLDSKRTLLFVMSGLNQEEGLVEKLTRSACSFLQQRRSVAFLTETPSLAHFFQLKVEAITPLNIIKHQH